MSSPHHSRRARPVRFVSNARLWWRKWSSWGAAFNAALWSAMMAKSGMLFGFASFLGFVPGRWRGFTAGLVCALIFVLTFVLPVILAQVKQPKLEKLCEKQDA